MKKLLPLLLTFAITGCATLFGDSRDSVSLDSEPQGATVTFRNEVICRTPCHVELPRRADTTYLIFKKEGYETKTALLSKTIAPVAWWNLGFITTTSGATSWGIDAASGKLFRYTPDSYIIELDKSVKTESNGPSGLEYTLENFDRLKVEIARGEGEFFHDLCASYGLTSQECLRFEENIRGSKQELMSTSNGVELYRRLQPLRS